MGGLSAVHLSSYNSLRILYRNSSGTLLNFNNAQNNCNCKYYEHQQCYDGKRSIVILGPQTAKSARNSCNDTAEDNQRDTITDSMDRAISETNRRRAIQMKYNEEHGITPQTIKKAVRDIVRISKKVEASDFDIAKDLESMNRKEIDIVLKNIQKKMNAAAADLNFELAAQLRDQMLEIKKQLQEME